MATTNLISKSLGDILTESGNGSPDHTSPKGSLYSDKDSGVIYQNLDGSTSWAALNTVAYGEGYYQDNTNATTISSTNAWVSVGNTFTEGEVLGFNVSGDTMTLLSGYDGKYEIRADATISYVAGTNNYELGVSVDGVNPANGTYGGALVDVTYTRQHIGVCFVGDFSGGTTFELAVRNLTNTDNIIIRHAQLFARRLG